MTAPDVDHLRPRVSTATVHVRWLVLETIVPRQWEEIELLLDDAERERASRFHFERDRLAYIAAHALARVLLSMAAPRPPTDWRFSAGEHGKPEIVRAPGVPPLRFNLSHTRGLVAAALTLEHDIGIDVEAVDASRFSLDLAERTFAPEEVVVLRATAADKMPEALFGFWTLKEACIKAMGQGLSVPLDAFALTFEPLAVRFSPSLGEDSARWVLRRFAPTPAHALALALRHPQPKSVVIEASALDAAALLASAAKLR